MKEQLINKEDSWTACPVCQGRGRRTRRVSDKARRRYQRALDEFNRISEQGELKPQQQPPPQPKGHLDICSDCQGTGLTPAERPPASDSENYPHLAIIGGGIGGVALAVACLHRGIPFTLYERDSGFAARSQGYGLTLQQASKAVQGLGITSLKEGVISTRHLVHTTDGKVIGEWGVRKWVHPDEEKAAKRTNIHIARQSLRLALLEQLGEHLNSKDHLKWGHQLIDLNEPKDQDRDQGVELTFLVDGKEKKRKADLVVGADGIRSTVRKLLISEEASPLRYLDCIVILGICPLENLSEVNSELLDSATVFQTANGHERIYMMPYDSESIMWQLSFPMPESEAKALSEKGTQALKDEACRRCQWHAPIPEILAATQPAQVSGYPVYDRALLQPSQLAEKQQVTLIGDAAHPMSPFKGQGANQAILDALALARQITKECRPLSDWKKEGLSTGIRKAILHDFESEMLERTAKKVKDSAAAAEFLHSDVVLHEGDEPRGRCLRRG